MGKRIILPAVLDLAVPLLFCGCGSGGGGSSGSGGASAPTTGTISGTVTDSVDAGALPDVEVTVNDRETGGAVLAVGTTDGYGRYSLTVPIGGCYVRFSKADYTPSACTFVGVVAGVPVTVDAKIAGATTGGWNVLDPADVERLKATKFCPGCRLYVADLRSEDLAGADLGSANLIGANLSGAIWPDSRVCEDNSIGECR